MNSRRMPPGASTKAMRRVPKVPLTVRGPQSTSWRASSASRSSTKRAGCRNPSVGQRAGVLVDRLREEGQGQRAELDVGATAVLPLHRFGHRRAGRLEPGARLFEVGDLHGQVGQARDGHQCSGVPYSEPRSSAMSSRRTPSGSEKYSEISLSICVGMPASSRRHPGGVPLRPVDRDGEVVEAAEHFGVRLEAEVREVEEGQRVVVSQVEEQVGRPLVVPVLEELGQREAEEALVEPDGLLDVGAQQRNVVDTPGGRRRALRRLLQVRGAQPLPLRRRGLEVDAHRSTILTGRGAMRRWLRGCWLAPGRPARPRPAAPVPSGRRPPRRGASRSRA